MAEGVSNVLFGDEAEQQLVFGIARCGLVGFPRWVTAFGTGYGTVRYGTVRYGMIRSGTVHYGVLVWMDGNIEDPTEIYGVCIPELDGQSKEPENKSHTV